MLTAYSSAGMFLNEASKSYPESTNAGVFSASATSVRFVMRVAAAKNAFPAVVFDCGGLCPRPSCPRPSLSSALLILGLRVCWLRELQENDWRDRPRFPVGSPADEQSLLVALDHRYVLSLGLSDAVERAGSPRAGEQRAEGTSVKEFLKR